MLSNLDFTHEPHSVEFSLALQLVSMNQENKNSRPTA